MTADATMNRMNTLHLQKFSLSRISVLDANGRTQAISQEIEGADEGEIVEAFGVMKRFPTFYIFLDSLRVDIDIQRGTA